MNKSEFEQEVESAEALLNEEPLIGNIAREKYIEGLKRGRELYIKGEIKRLKKLYRQIRTNVKESKGDVKEIERARGMSIFISQEVSRLQKELKSEVEK